MNASLFFISDIHLSDIKAENEGLVINAFLADFQKQLKTLGPTEVFVLIGGDLLKMLTRRVYTRLSMNISLSLCLRWVSRRRI